jgi:hypothetical protein
LSQQLEDLAKNDQGLQKRRRWGCSEVNTTALEQIYKQFSFVAQILDFYLATPQTNQLFPIKQRLEMLVEESKRADSGISRMLNAVGQEFETDEQLSLLRRKRLEGGIADLDIKAHQSSIKTLLHETLHSYHEAHSGPSRGEAHIFIEVSKECD